MYICGKDMRVIVWCCFWDYGHTKCYFIDRDFEAKKHGYSANSYIQVLDAGIGPDFEELNNIGYIFMQDNASIHIAHKVKDWFKNTGIKMFPWPPYSLDLSPIEHV
jgi:hypothetical protein